MIGWSYNLLSEAERTLFRRLAIFSGGFTFDSATAVCASHPIERDDVFDLLSGLIRKSLVAEDAETDGRYRLLESLRAFARERLADAGELQRTARLHAEYFAGSRVATTLTFATRRRANGSTGSSPISTTFAPRSNGRSTSAATCCSVRRSLPRAIAFFNDVMPGEAVRMMRRAIECLPPGGPLPAAGPVFAGNSGMCGFNFHPLCCGAVLFDCGG